MSGLESERRIAGSKEHVEVLLEDLFVDDEPPTEPSPFLLTRKITRPPPAIVRKQGLSLLKLGLVTGLGIGAAFLGRFLVKRRENHWHALWRGFARAASHG